MTITKEGSLASFYTVNKAPIKHLKVYFSPKQAGSGDPSPENVREISGWNSLTISHTPNTNLFDQSNLLNASGWQLCEEIPTFQGLPVYKGTISNLRSKYANELPVNFKYKENTQYTISWWWRRVTPSTANGLKPQFFYTDGTSDLGSNNSNNTSEFKHYYKTSTSGKTLSAIGLQYNSSTTIYLSGFAIQEYIGRDISKPLQSCNTIGPISWQAQLGTIYGGYVDLITGELIETNKKLILDGSSDENWWAYDTYDQYKGFALDNSGLKSGIRQIGYANWLPVTSTPTANNLECWLGVNNTRIYCASTASLVSTYSTSAWRAYLNENPLEIVIPLATPIVYQLTPQQLQTFVGQNNIWSNADQVEVEYDLAESNDELYRRRNIILQSVPHLETASGNIANFNTDLMAPLKECKIYFNPIQLGSGDVSPENVRSISGWTGLNIYHIGKNFFNISDTIYKRTNYNIFGFINHLLPNTQYTFSINGNTTHTYGLSTRTEASITPILSTSLTKGWPGAGEYEIIMTPDIMYEELYLTGDGGGGAEDMSKILPQVELGSNNTAYEPYIENNITLSWENNQGTLYGGYVDLINGEIVETYKYYNLGNNNIFHWSYGGGNGTIWFGNIANNNIFMPVLTNSTVANLYCNNYTVRAYSTFSHNNNMDLSIGWDTVGAPRIRNNTYDASTREQFIESLNNSYIVIELKNPIHHSLTPQTLKTLKGTNNIWSDANGPVSITYWTH